ncbi:MAG TPA: hypothetical protein VJ505_15755 [Holophagaceae bacterium]|nr:hypothetical protein [Holophagaceae bacterium]
MSRFAMQRRILGRGLLLGLLLLGAPIRAQEEPEETRAETIQRLMPVDCNEKLRPVQKEDCSQCKFLPCLRDTLAQKKQMIQVYEGLKAFWIQRHLDDAGNPVLERNLASLKEPERSTVFRTTLTQLSQFTTMETAATSHVSRASTCGYSSRKDLTVATDTFEFCRTCIGQLNAAMEAQPCQQLADLLAAHEAYHAANCAKRQVAGEWWVYEVKGADGRTASKHLPPSILTPAGKAADEIAAYQVEVKALSTLIENLERRCTPTRDYTSSHADPEPDHEPRNPPPSTKPAPLSKPAPLKAPPMPKPKPIPGPPPPK